MRVETREVYIAEDGRQFPTADECQAHERDLAAQAKRIENLVVYRVTHSFDGTEGRGYFGSTIIVTDASLAVVIQYCLDRWGQPLTGWYGDSHYEVWVLRRDDRKDALDRAFEDAGTRPPYASNHKARDLVFLSATPIEHDKLRSPVFPWPRKSKKDAA